ncbi:LCP family protein [Aquihabitans sp. G128]|uniref:LCP family protein n=1 Tax=Aquihabitans sp. G128 TaxID=2849779 RepID=UPI001C2321C5|nr:LCP family protein [Aquihabitans sp. G128]QXC63197.1 LCP family protein [Aquihabitans sp. G128]
MALDDAVGGPSNYLVVGSDSRSGGDPLDPSAGDDHAPLADTIMLLRIDPGKKQAKMLSLPRDLWVTLDTTGRKGRINAAYSKGPQELVDTLRDELDVPINHYVEVDFQGFQDIVSAIDGVPMWFDRAMRDRNTGLDVLHPGCIDLDGRNALAFARSRHLEYFSHGGFTYDGTGDLGRISRQQLFLRRVIDRAKDKGISNPLTLKRLVDAGTSNVTIDDQLSVGDLLALGRRFSSFDSAALQTYTLPNTPRTTSGGAQIVEVDRTEAEPILALFRDPVATTATTDGAGPTSGAGSSSTTAVTSDVAPADVDVTVLNSSGQQGEAVKVADQLVTVGFTVDHFGNGEELQHPSEDHTVVRYAAGQADEARTVAASIRGTVAVEEDASLDRGAVVLFLGADWAGLAPTTTTRASSSTSSSTTSTTVAAAPEQSEVVGMIPGDPPPGESCG